MVNNPCSQCLVVAMCKEGCFKLVIYLEKIKCISMEGGSDMQIPIDVVAYGVRNKILALCEGDKKWRWTNKWK